MKCRSKKEMKDTNKITLTNGKTAIQGACPTCGTKMFRISTPTTSQEFVQERKSQVANVLNQKEVVQTKDQASRVSGEDRKRASGSVLNTLFKMAKPDIYRINAFRILSLPITTSLKEVNSQVRKLDQLEKFGTVNEQKDSNIFPVKVSRDQNARHEALQRLLDPELRFIDEFFWFWPLSLSARTEDNTILFIQQGNFSQSLSIWKSQEDSGNEASISMHNLAIYYHATALDLETMKSEGAISKEQVTKKQSYWDQAFSRWKMLLKDEAYWHRLSEMIHELDDPRLTMDTIIQIREGLPKTLLSINALLAVKASEMNNITDMTFHLSLIRKSGFDVKIIEEALHNALTPMRDRIKALCLSANEETVNKAQKDQKTASNLIDLTSPLLTTIDKILPEGDVIRESIHDQVAIQARASVVSYSNETKDWQTALTLQNKALNVAASLTIKQKIKSEIDILANNIEYASCWFCRASPPDEHSKAVVMMHGNVLRIGTKIQWKKLPIMVPRCKQCKNAHMVQRRLRWGGAVVGIVLGIITWIISVNFLVGVGTFCGCWGLGYLISLILFPKGIKPESSKKGFRGVIDAQLKGWVIGEKPPGVR